MKPEYTDIVDDYKPTVKDWSNDFKYENGFYQNTCRMCKADFMGHKRRLICRECTTANLRSKG